MDINKLVGDLPAYWQFLLECFICRQTLAMLSRKMWLQIRENRLWCAWLETVVQKQLSRRDINGHTDLCNHIKGAMDRRAYYLFGKGPDRRYNSLLVMVIVFFLDGLL
jgi:hypothetical protein